MRHLILKSIVGSLFVFGSVGAALSQEAAQAPQKKAAAPRVYQLVTFKLGPAWAKDKPLVMQPGIQEHGAYMSKLIKEGILVLGGPLFEDSKLSVADGRGPRKPRPD